MRLLVADGDRAAVSSLKRALTDEGYTVDVALNGEHALWHATEFDYDAVLLDEVLPILDGAQVATRLRARKPAMVILMLTSGDGDGDVDVDVDPCPETDADGDVVKPIDVKVLVARLRALIGTRTEPGPPQMQVGDLRMDPATRQAWRGDRELNLSPREFTFLRLLLTHPGQVLSRHQILDQVWARTDHKAPNLVDQYVLYLRRKIDRPFGVHQLETVRGIGYRLREQSTED